MNKYIRVRPRDDGQGWAVDVYDGRTWTQTHGPMNKDSAHRLAHKFRLNIEMAADRVGATWSDEPFFSDGEAREADRLRAEMEANRLRRR